MPERYQKVGRGGAGNYVSQGPIGQARGVANDDPEAQRGITGLLTTSAPKNARTGRGGSGNFHDSAILPVSDPSLDGAEAVRPISRAHAYSGRGGAGNWGIVAAVTGVTKPTLAPRGVETLDRKVMQDVEAGLAIPPRAHTQQARLGTEDGSE